MLRLSVTELDNYRLWREGDWMETSDLLSRLRGIRTSSEKMEAGTAWHAYLESLPSGNVTLTTGQKIESGDFTYLIDCDDAVVRLPKIRETKTERRVKVGNIEVVLSGMADGIGPGEIFDHKLTGDFDAEGYADAIQWRAYLWMFGCDKFTYNCFEANKSKRDGLYHISEFHELSFYNYDRLERDVMKWVTELTEFVTRWVPERLNDPVADEKLLPF